MDMNESVSIEDVETMVTLERLYEIVLSRRGADPLSSHTARLFDRGINKIAQKVGEEATETVIAALAEGRESLIAESADLLYHLTVLWASAGVEPQEVYEELAKRAQRPAKKKDPEAEDESDADPV